MTSRTATLRPSAAALLAFALALTFNARAEDAQAPSAAPAADAAAPPAPRAGDGVYDPFEGYNRVMFSFNMKVDRAVLRPVARAYRNGVPQPVRTGVANFLDNLEEPLNLVNNALQAKPVRAANDLSRFVINLTFGIGGIFDPATRIGLKRSQEDFGQTLGKWGWDQGAYLVLPFLPPGGLRDQLGRVPEVRTDPWTYAESEWVEYGGKALDIVEGRSRVLDFDEALDQAYDPYAFVRDAVTQRRAYLVRDGVAEAVDYDDLYADPLEDEAGAPTEPPPR